VKRKEKLRFIQWTNKGYLTCSADVPIGICSSCGARIWDEAAESIIEEAVRLEYDKLPNDESGL
jgi:YgiT-type zinc finger domain-containing protein